MFLVQSFRTIFLFGILWRIVQKVNMKSISNDFLNPHNTSLLRIPREAGDLGGSCITPPQLVNGKWSYLANSETAAIPGQLVPPSSVIVFKCNKGYTFSFSDENQHIIFCEDGKWVLGQNFRCEKLCPPIHNTTTTTVTCYKRGFLVSCEKAVHRTTIKYTCEPFYENFGPSSGTCVNGRWTSAGVICTPICGEKRVSSQPLIVNGSPVERGNYPWVVAIFSNIGSDSFVNICGGTLLSLKLVLTAAHCVSNVKNGAPYPTTHYRAAAGKYYNKYEDPRDQDTSQYSEINKIEVQPEFKGEVQNFRGDIAILKLVSSLLISSYVQPVCYRDLPNFPINFNDQGIITGWGYTNSAGNPSNKLRELEVPYVNDNLCRSEFGREWERRYFTTDKMCAGFSNQGTSVCSGDSGGGLVFKNPRNERYYIHGIVSLSHLYQQNNINLCDVQKSSLFTRVLSYFDWMLEHVDSLSIEGCTFPIIIANGKWAYPYADVPALIDGSFPETSMLFAECNSGYKLVPDAYQIQCLDGQWNLTETPVCNSSKQMFCPSIDPKPHTIFICKLGNNIIPCSEAVDGTVLRYSCEESYVLSTIATNPFSICTNGSWSSTISECIPEGTKLCPPVTNTSNTAYRCEKANNAASCTESTDGTVLQFSCRKYYEPAPNSTDSFSTCTNGSWSSSVTQCNLICGMGKQSSSLLSPETDSRDVLLKYPWTVGIFPEIADNPNVYAIVCEGYMITPQLILAGAHCLTLRFKNGTYYEPKDYRVFAGYAFQGSWHPKDIPTSQQGRFEEIVRHPDFDTNRKSDIAVAKLTKIFKLSEGILPVCIPDPNTNSDVLKSNAVGTLSGWNATDINILLELEVPFIDKENCISVLGEQYTQYFSVDKFCGGYLQKNTSMCTIVDGAGLFLKNNQNNRYYIHGLLSIQSYVKENGTDRCQDDKYGLFTNITYHYDWIQSTVKSLSE